MKSNTPICDFVKKYAEKKCARFHMPGHKGKNVTGTELLDITEIDGADSLYESKGVIAESEKIASDIFETYSTLYSCEGSSQCIRAMLYMTKLIAGMENKKPVIAATRNAHKVFALTCALLDINVIWIENERENLCSCRVTPQNLENTLTKYPYVTAVYVTSPDYLGYIADIKNLSQVAHSHGCPILVDNAHGAYLKFARYVHHPIDCGADICCDSAHKTLPVLTGGAYLHVSHSAYDVYKQNAKDAMALFGSTSPSYLILQSLDNANGLILDGYAEKIRSTVTRLSYFKDKFINRGWIFLKNDEPLKLTIDARENGYTGDKLAKLLITRKVIPEYYDPDYVVLMVSAENDYDDFAALQNALDSIPQKKKLVKTTFNVPHKAVMSMKKALTSPCEYVDVNSAVKRILASPTVSCPPAVPILYGGETVTEQAVEAFIYYGIKQIKVIK